MTNTKLLLEWIDKSGYKRSYIAAQLGLSTFGLQRKIENASEFKPSEINALCKLLKINTLREKERVFFAREVEKTAT